MIGACHHTQSSERKYYRRHSYSDGGRFRSWPRLELHSEVSWHFPLARNSASVNESYGDFSAAAAARFRLHRLLYDSGACRWLAATHVGVDSSGSRQPEYTLLRHSQLEFRAGRAFRSAEEELF